MAISQTGKIMPISTHTTSNPVKERDQNIEKLVNYIQKLWGQEHLSDNLLSKINKEWFKNKWMKIFRKQSGQISDANSASFWSLNKVQTWQHKLLHTPHDTYEKLLTLLCSLKRVKSKKIRYHLDVHTINWISNNTVVWDKFKIFLNLCSLELSLVFWQD